MAYFGRFWVKKHHHSEIISHENCYLYHSTRLYLDYSTYEVQRSHHKAVVPSANRFPNSSPHILSFYPLFPIPRCVLAESLP